MNIQEIVSAVENSPDNVAAVRIEDHTVVWTRNTHPLQSDAVVAFSKSASDLGCEVVKDFVVVGWIGSARVLVLAGDVDSEEVVAALDDAELATYFNLGD